MRRNLLSLFIFIFIGLQTLPLFAQNKLTMFKVPVDLVYQHNKVGYGPSFFGMSVGLGIERYIFHQVSLSIAAQSIQNFTVLGIVPFTLFNTEFRYYLSPQNFKGMYLGATYSYGFDDNTRYNAYAPEGGYQFYLTRSWYLDANFSIGSGQIKKIESRLYENSDGVAIRAGIRIGKAF